MGNIYRALIAAFAVLFGFGLATGAATAGQDAKREEDVREIVTVQDDDDDDDTRSRDNTGTVSRTGNSVSNSVSRSKDQSAVSNDGTNSRVTAVSRDKDRSRGDLTKDWTRDGGDRTRDWSRNDTNDNSRNDTR